MCVRGECHCFVGWGGPGCESPRASCMEQCSGHGTFLADANTCNCDPNWTGHDCSTGQYSGIYVFIYLIYLFVCLLFSLNEHKEELYLVILIYVHR